jgi:hypothetical protein
MIARENGWVGGWGVPLAHMRRLVVWWVVGERGTGTGAIPVRICHNTVSSTARSIPPLCPLCELAQRTLGEGGGGGLGVGAHLWCPNRFRRTVFRPRPRDVIRLGGMANGRLLMWVELCIDDTCRENRRLSSALHVIECREVYVSICE